jgi:hypothetical protein
MSFLDAFMAGVRLVESGSLEGDYQAVNRKARPGGPSLAFGAYQMLFYDPDVHDEPQGFIPYLMSQAGVVGDIRVPAIQDAVARRWFTDYHDQFGGNWLLVAAAWHIGARAVADRIVEPSGLLAAEVDLATIERLVPGESVYVSAVMDAAALMAPAMHPDAIDVTDEVPLPGKPWVGGSGNRKLVLHTIEGGDSDEIGWPRDWTRWTLAPHLVINSDRWPDRDWLYQTLPLDVAGYALRDNAGEDDRFVWQVEVAGRADKVATYPDSFYQALADLCQWFVTEMGVPDVWLDFSCCRFGAETECRRTRAEIDRFSGFMGHCHFGRGIDTHGDPGHLDVERLRSFMQPLEEDPMAGFYIIEDQVDDRRRRLYWVERIQAKLGILEGGDPGRGNRALIAGAGMSLGVNDAATQALLTKWIGATKVGPTEDRRLDQAVAAREPSLPGEHTHPEYALKGHDHDEYSPAAHAHPFTGTTDNPNL